MRGASPTNVVLHKQKQNQASLFCETNNMSSMFSSLFARDPLKDFHFEIVQKCGRNVDTDLFTFCKGKKKGTDEECSIFFADFKALNPNEANLAKTCAKRLKTLKHPSILAYIDSLETDGLVEIVTEHVVPLTEYLDSIRSMDADRRELLISYGLYHISSVVKFLTQDAKLVHNNLNLASIFVNKCGDWKLFGLEYMHSSADSAPTKPYALEKYNPPEAKSGSQSGAVWSTDSWGLACLIWEIFNSPMSQGGSTTLKSPKQIPKILHPAYAKLIAVNPAQRSSPEQFIEICRKPQGFMKNKLVDALLFLDEFQLKDAREKTAFFNHLNEVLDAMPEEMQKYKILPQLSNAFEFGNAGSAVLAPLLKVSKLLKDEEYQQHIVPCVVKLFGSPDRATRVKLLQQIETFIEHLQPAIVNDKIFPHLLSGFTDTIPAVRESSVKAIIHLAPKLNYNNLNVELMKHFARLQSKDDQPGIRTNTTICMGKIAGYVNSQVRQRILISAFTRALKDPFPPARIAGILALSATQQYYFLNEVAFKILPALCSCTMDPEKQVRDQAFKAVKGFLDNLEKASEKPELIAEMEAQVNANSSSGVISESVPQWANWAFSALSSKFYKGPPVAKVPGQEATSGTTVDMKQTNVLSKSDSSSEISRKEPTKIEAKVVYKDEWDKNDENWGEMEETEDISASATNEGWDVEEDEPWESLEDQKQHSLTSAHIATKANTGKQHTPFDESDDDSTKYATSTKTTKQSSVKTSTAATSSVNQKPVAGGWDVEDEAAGDSGDWDENNWGSGGDVQQSNAQKEAKRKQALEKAQQRKTEMEEKRAAKQSGPLKLGARKIT